MSVIAHIAIYDMICTNELEHQNVEKKIIMSDFWHFVPRRMSSALIAVEVGTMMVPLNYMAVVPVLLVILNDFLILKAVMVLPSTSA